jgi:hypothetical protein
VVNQKTGYTRVNFSLGETISKRKIIKRQHRLKNHHWHLNITMLYQLKIHHTTPPFFLFTHF